MSRLIAAAPSVELINPSKSCQEPDGNCRGLALQKATPEKKGRSRTARLIRDFNAASAAISPATVYCLRFLFPRCL
ncbi:unnamed protein product [Nezara viridula]|uniref:Uncharacterized protein n=1 Tax=Nezara viridula TaxID=85310 RepID=A0A9P0MRH3_NEZVI|nr:unnamed protein product [Nezara viridula]